MNTSALPRLRTLNPACDAFSLPGLGHYAQKRLSSFISANPICVL
jgi:hypothetical protein